MLYDRLFLNQLKNGILNIKIKKKRIGKDVIKLDEKEIIRLYIVMNLNQFRLCFNLRKRQDEPKDIPEWILRMNEGYSRVWDCGNYKFNLFKSFI